MSPYERRGKRVLDVALVVLAAPLWVPVALGAALLVRVALGRPVLFRQQRPGKDGRPFTMLKFRTMHEAFGPDGSVLPDSARLTRVGSVLRKASLDELPELMNVLRGDMSVVGPRPLLLEYLPLYSERQARRHEVRPGVTGWAQVSGRNLTDWSDRLEQDVWYVENVSLKLDLNILAMTIPAVLLRRGINQSGEVTMKRFEG